MTSQNNPYRDFERILFCTDFSENADHAFDVAVDMARRRPHATLYLLHVVPEPEAQFWKTYLYEVDDIDDKARADIDRKIDDVYRPRVPEDVTFEAETRVGKVHDEILRFAAEKEIDLLILGRQGTSMWNQWLFGDVAEKVSRHATCAVLIIPLRDEDEGGGAD